MSARLLDGRAVAADLLKQCAVDAAEIGRVHGRAPTLATVLVGDDPASHTYVRMKANRCAEVGIESRRIEVDASTSTDELLAILHDLSADPGVDGILLQHPVPSQIDERAAFEAIAADKDVDGVTHASFAAMADSGVGYHSATPGGILRLLDAYEIALAGRHAVVIGRSAILGRPMGMLLLGRNATVTYCHSRTVGLADHVGRADILVAAAGVPGVVEGDWVKPGAVVVDAGYADNRGDVQFDSASQRASFITPVPGGVGPMTIATLLEQTVAAARRQLVHVAVAKG
ncbi:bifunctional 5,10-methylene-tetrahydrofolate dehydrogenase/5,10-methylene-tetrahydrofolate cyclohydrolase [Nocardioides sp. Root1257]|nr:bifunctional 5,10-methylene-tetrahydrofolate dehydrogenase/5,10-methylene-tetrahydrofolate cyclohydrolase [Nocardioides sp. Root1257]KRC43215.1 bifunctional 5,10-methylene-tetrahydrofolate dehydrogenase/5,10-methylene-tetrahydrofolate cyclohydrolase [Nocardioides sp. Root224]